MKIKVYYTDRSFWPEKYQEENVNLWTLWSPWIIKDLINSPEWEKISIRMQDILRKRICPKTYYDADID